MEHSELDKRPSPFEPIIPYPYLYLSIYLASGLTTANFGRNQLLPVSIGFLPLLPSQKNACPQHLCRPPPPFTGTSPCPGVDQPVSGRIQVTQGAFTPSPSLPAGNRFRYGYSVKDYPRHSNTLPGTLFETDDTHSKVRVPL